MFSQEVSYSGPDAGGIPILELEADVSSWEVGDQIVVAATHFDSRESEVFTIVECQGELYFLHFLTNQNLTVKCFMEKLPTTCIFRMYE